MPSRGPELRHPKLYSPLLVCGLWALLVVPAGAQCDPGGGMGGMGADVVVSDLTIPLSYGNAGGYHAYSVGTTSCNIGTEELVWEANTPNHPVIAQNLYRLKDGRFEQIGMSWLKHGFTAIAEDECGCGCIPSGTPARLGVGCSDPYAAVLNGDQSELGPRSDVTDPALGIFIFPPSLTPPVPDLTTRRLRVKSEDVDPLLNPGALYWAEGHYLSPDDAAAGNSFNNASYRPVVFGTDPVDHEMEYTGPTVKQLPAIEAWPVHDPEVQLVDIFASGGGRLILGSRVSDNGDGTFRYEYALFNMDSTRAVGRFEIPIPSGLTVGNLGFHDVEYHSGEVYDGTDWTPTLAADSVSWATEEWSTNPNANALRYSTLYNFGFDANSPPTQGPLVLGYFIPGSPDTVTVTTQVPSSTFTIPVGNLTCGVDGLEVDLSWINGEIYDSIEIWRDGVVLATLGGSATQFTDAIPLVGEHTYSVVANNGSVPSGPVNCVVDLPAPLLFGFPQGVPTLLDPNGSVLEVSIVATPGATLQPGSAQLWVDDGTPQTIPLLPLGGDLYEAAFPPFACGAPVGFRFSAETTTGIVVSDPPAEEPPYAAFAGTGVTDEPDDFELDLGWVSGAPGDDATAGLWERVDPIGTDAQPENDHTPDPGVIAWVTGQGTVGGSIGENDVDGGSTTLLSPVLDMSGLSDPLVSYWRWYSNDEGGNPGQDVFLVEVTSDGVFWETVETVGPDGPEASGEWFYHEFRVADFVALTDSVQIRFIASDLGGASIVEAALDDFRLFDVSCFGSDPFRRGDCNGDGTIDIADPITELDFLFGSGTIDCHDACDANDDGALDIADPIYLLTFSFSAGDPPPPPFPDCGPDTTDDGLDCGLAGGCP